MHHIAIIQRGFLHISRYAHNIFCMSEVLQNIILGFFMKLVPGNSFASFAQSRYNILYISGVSPTKYVSLELWLLLSCLLLWLCLLSFVTEFFCYLGNIIVVFIFDGSHVSPFSISLLLIIGPFLDFMERFHFSFFYFTSSYEFFAFPYDFTFLFHLLIQNIHFFL